MGRTSLLVALALLLGAAGSAEAKRHCDPPKSRTVVANAQVRIYAVPTRHRIAHVVWACHRHTGARYELGSRERSDPDYPNDIRVRLSGRLVGALSTSANRYGAAGYVIKVFDARTGAVLHQYGRSGDSMQEGGTAWLASLFVMDRAGSVAWIATARHDDGTEDYVVLKSDAGFSAETLDSGPAIDPASLRRSGRTVSWLNAGEPRSARLAR